MTESLFSPYWYRVAGLRPRLAGTVSISRQNFRDEQWYVLASRSTGRQFRVNALGYQFVGRLDGRLTVQQIWDQLVRELGNDAPSQHEVLHMLSELTAASMASTEQSLDLANVFDHAERRRAGRRGSLLSLKVPLFDPTRLLDAVLPAVQPLFSRTAFLLWLLAVIAALVTAGMHFSELRSYGARHLLTPANLAIMWFCYPLIKAAHEMAHGLAVRHWGGEVHETGATLFLFIPVPYVDASAASAFPEKSRRILVSAMGIMVETAIAAAALALWLAASDSLLREAAFACLLIGGVSTLLVNANPLMRFDGYHVLTDWLELPGLATRSEAALRHLGERWLLGNHHLPPPAGTEGHRLLLVSYGLASWVYRILLFVGMLAWISAKNALAGLALAVFLLWKYLAQPALKLVRHVWTAPRLEACRTRAIAGLVVIVGGLVLLLGVVPMPYTTLTQGVVWVPPEAQVRNETEGFVEQVLVSDGQQVSSGQPLVVLVNPDLDAAIAQMQARIDEQQAVFQASLLGQPALAVASQEAIDKLGADLAELQRRRNGLTLRAPRAGKLALPDGEDLPGSFFPRGSNIAHVIAPADMTVRAVMRQQDVDLLQKGVRAIEVRLSEARGHSLPAQLLAQTPAATFLLPSPALGDRGGGPVITDPADGEGTRALESFFVLDLRVPGSGLERIGSRAWVRIEYERAPLARQWLRSLRQVFVKQFGARGAAMLGTDLDLP